MLTYTTSIICKNRKNPPFYNFVFDNLEEKYGFKLVDIRQNPDATFHINFDKTSLLDSLVLDKIEENLKEDYKNKIIDTNIYISHLNMIYNRNYIYDIFNTFEIPNLGQVNIGDMDKKKLEFPFVLKEKNTSQGKGIYFIENKNQLDNLNMYYGKTFEDSFRYSKFIETESDYYNHFRIFTLGSGEILGSTLNYSANKKDDLEGVLYSDRIFDNPDSMLYLDRKRITSNVSQGSNSIALNPNDLSKKITPQDKYILDALNIKNQELPEALEIEASYAARILSGYGFYILGQDWIQEKKTGKFFCLEVNYNPQTNIFNSLYNHGIKDELFGKQKAGELIAKGIHDSLENNN